MGLSLPGHLVPVKLDFCVLFLNGATLLFEDNTPFRWSFWII